MAGPTTNFSSLGVKSSPTNNSNGLYAPQLTDKQITAIPVSIKKNGGIWYNQDTKNLEAVVNDAIQIVQVGPGGQGDVVGPNASTKGNIAIFNDGTGKLIADSGVDIAQVPTPAPLLRFSSSLKASSFEAPTVTVNEIGNLGHIKFTNGLGLIFVDTLMPVEFITNTYKTFTQVCSLFTDGLPSSSTSPSALVELQSDSGALLLSRMTTTERNNNLSTPSGANGMLLFNTTTTTFDGFDGTNWRALPQLNIDGTLTAADPIDSTNLATKNYVDTSISGAGSAPATAKYIIQTSNSTLTNAQVLGSLTTGLLKNTTTTGVLSIATAGTDYYSSGNPTRILDNASNFFIGTLAGNLTTTSTSSTGIGVNALTALTSGVDNTSTGSANLKNTTTGAGNSSFGARSLVANIIGGYNCAFGAESLISNLATGNCGFGYRSLYSNINGINNTAVGSIALLSVTGDHCTAVGAEALSSSSGTHNTALGSRASYSGTTGSNNVFIGYFAGGLYQLYDKCIFIGDSADANATSRSNSVAIGYQAIVGADNCMVLGGSGANQLSVGIGITPNAQLQLPTIHAARKFVLYETANNDNQIFGFGTSAGIFNFQIDNTTSNYIWSAATSSSGSNSLMCLTGTGFLGIGYLLPHAPLQFSNALVNRKIVLAETANNDHQVFGFGVNSGILRYQIDASTSSHVWYAGASSSSSTELMRLSGNSTLYTKQSYATYWAIGTGNTIIITSGTLQKLTLPSSTISSSFNNFSYTSSRVTYDGVNAINALVTVSIRGLYTGGVPGEFSTYAIIKNGATTLATMSSPSFTNDTVQLGSMNTISPIANGDYFEIWGTHSVGSGTRTVVIDTVNISVSST